MGTKLPMQHLGEIIASHIVYHTPYMPARPKT